MMTGKEKLLIVQRIRKNLEALKTLTGKEKLLLAKTIRTDKQKVGMRLQENKNATTSSPTAEKFFAGEYNSVDISEFCKLFQQVRQELAEEHHSFYPKIGNLWWSRNKERYGHAKEIFESIFSEKEWILDFTKEHFEEYQRCGS